MAKDDDQIPEHRSGYTPRSGDRHEIRKDGKLHNVDQEAREAAARPVRKAPTKKAAKAKRPAAARPAPAPAPATGDSH